MNGGFSSVETGYDGWPEFQSGTALPDFGLPEKDFFPSKCREQHRPGVKCKNSPSLHDPFCEFLGLCVQNVSVQP